MTTGWIERDNCRREPPKTPRSTLLQRAVLDSNWEEHNANKRVVPPRPTGVVESSPAILELDAVYEFVSAAKPRAALNAIFRSFDQAFRAGRFVDVDAVLTSADLTKLDSFTLVGLLTSTVAAKGHLPGRSALWARVRQRLLEMRRDPKEVDQMLGGLR